jgi:hypothetical protein
MSRCLDVGSRCVDGSIEPLSGLRLGEALALRRFETAQLRSYLALGSLDEPQQADAARLVAAEARTAAALGDHAGAATFIRWADDHAGGLPRHERMAILHEQAWLAAAGDRSAVDVALVALECAGEVAPDAMIPLAVRRWTDGDRAVLAGAALDGVDDRDAREALDAGRGDMLLAWLRRQSGLVSGSGRRAVLAGLVYRVIGRAEVGAWLRTEDSWIDLESLARTWRAAAQRLAIATRLGDRVTADAMRAVAARHRAVVERADLAVTLSVLAAY